MAQGAKAVIQLYHKVLHVVQCQQQLVDEARRLSAQAGQTCSGRSSAVPFHNMTAEMGESGVASTAGLGRTLM
jgi:hypothetical protein